MESKKLLAEKYINDECTKEEARVVLQWFQTDEGQAYLEQRMSEDQHSLAKNHQFLFEIPLDRRITLGQKSEPGTLLTRKKDLARTKVKPKKWYLAIAAVALLSIALVVFLRHWSDTIEYRTTFGETKNIVLPDGSEVVLNGNSLIRYGNFKGNTSIREVWLEGEGYFSVTHLQQGTPFIIHVQDSLQVAVLGTEFNLSARENKLRVVLDTGKIQVNMKDGRNVKKINMSPGQLVELSDAKPYFVKKEVNPTRYSSWKRGELIFENTSFEEIAETLNHTYGLSVVVEDEAMLRQQVNGTVPNDDIQKLLHGLSLLFNARVERQDGVVVFTN